jgi:hypothetical protein
VAFHAEAYLITFLIHLSIFTPFFNTGIIPLTTMINYILLYKIRKRVKKILKEKIADEEIATTPRSCLGCLADEISWEIYYLLKENKD